LTGFLAAPQWQQIIATLKAVGFSLYVPKMEESPQASPQPLFKGLTEFREHLGGELTLMLLEGIGQGREVHQVDLDLYQQAIALLRDNAAEGGKG